jgi:hypothetical protein
VQRRIDINNLKALIDTEDNKLHTKLHLVADSLLDYHFYFNGGITRPDEGTLREPEYSLPPCKYVEHDTKRLADAKNNKIAYSSFAHGEIDDRDNKRPCTEAHCSSASENIGSIPS